MLSVSTKLTLNKFETQQVLVLTSQARVQGREVISTSRDSAVALELGAMLVAFEKFPAQHSSYENPSKEN